jgi:hypothetical protein
VRKPLGSGPKWAARGNARNFWRPKIARRASREAYYRRLSSPRYLDFDVFKPLSKAELRELGEAAWKSQLPWPWNQIT